MSNPYRPDDVPGYGTQDETPYATNAPYAQNAPSPYGSSPYGAGPYPVSVAPQQNQLALIALICSLAGLLTGFSLLAGIVCGHVALSQIKQQPQQQGRGMAIAALWIGYGLLVLGVLAIVMFVALMSNGFS